MEQLEMGHNLFAMPDRELTEEEYKALTELIEASRFYGARLLEGMSWLLKKMIRLVFWLVIGPMVLVEDYKLRRKANKLILSGKYHQEDLACNEFGTEFLIVRRQLGQVLYVALNDPEMLDTNIFRGYKDPDGVLRWF